MRIGARFEYQIDDLSEAQLTGFFTELLASHSWSAVKLDLYGLKFYSATRYCCSPAGKVASSAQRAPERTSIPVASRAPCTKWSTPAA